LSETGAGPDQVVTKATPIKRQRELNRLSGIAKVSNQPVRVEILYSGNVQGVGFRYTVRSVAQSYRVVGFVKNLRDGRVQLVAESDAAEIEQFLRAVADRMSGYIRDTEREEGPATGEFSAFDIAF
jgi:acylphosphatase